MKALKTDLAKRIIPATKNILQMKNYHILYNGTKYLIKVVPKAN